MAVCVLEVDVAVLEVRVTVVVEVLLIVPESIHQRVLMAFVAETLALANQRTAKQHEGIPNEIPDFENIEPYSPNGRFISMKLILRRIMLKRSIDHVPLLLPSYCKWFLYLMCWWVKCWMLSWCRFSWWGTCCQSFSNSTCSVSSSSFDFLFQSKDDHSYLPQK